MIDHGYKASFYYKYAMIEKCQVIAVAVLLTTFARMSRSSLDKSSLCVVYCVTIGYVQMD